MAALPALSAFIDWKASLIRRKTFFSDGINAKEPFYLSLPLDFSFKSNVETNEPLPNASVCFVMVESEHGWRSAYYYHHIHICQGMLNL